MLDASSHDRLTQRVNTLHVRITEEGNRLYPVQIRYAWPSELDLMAQLAGLRLRHRYGDWNRVKVAGLTHVSIYERAR